MSETIQDAMRRLARGMYQSDDARIPKSTLREWADHIDALESGLEAASMCIEELKQSREAVTRQCGKYHEQRDELVAALREIEKLGHSDGHGLGYTCANMAEDALSRLQATDPVVQECIKALTEDPDDETPVLDSDRDQTLADHEQRIVLLADDLKKLAYDHGLRIKELKESELMDAARETVDAMTEDLDTPPSRNEFEELRLEVQKLQHRFDILDMAMKGAMQAAKKRQDKKDDD